jgi:hypothetical protein
MVVMFETMLLFGLWLLLQVLPTDTTSLPPIPTPVSDWTGVLNWKKAATGTISRYDTKASDPPKNVPVIADEPKKRPDAHAGEKKSEPLGEPKKLEPRNDPKMLKEQLAELLREREGIVKESSGDSASTSESAKLRKQLLEMIGKLEQQKKAPPPAPHPDPKKPGGQGHPPEKFDLPTDKEPIDKVRAALNLYKAGEVDAAARAFKMIDTSILTKEDRAFTQYMTAGCLRKTGKVSEAMVIYREIADAKEDGFLTECALWQLGAIRSAQELETQLEQLRARRKSK